MQPNPAPAAAIHDLLQARHDLGLDDVPVAVGGTIPPADVETLKHLGVAAVFSVGSRLDDVVAGILGLAAEREQVG